METYILKIILSASILILLYYLFLEKERSFRFNRFYLLFALVFSYSVPFISLNFPQTQKTQTNLVFQEATSQVIIPASKVNNAFNWELFLLILYSIITIFFIIKSIFSIVKILKLKGKSIEIEDQKIKILDENLSPFSFFGTLYLGKNYLKNNKIDERIFLHEKNHIEQKHSLDLLFIEVLIILSWFNPILYLYKKTIITNHEFLADENVIAQKFEIKLYQKLILEEISTYQNRNFTNQFNFNNTKKRFIMMTKPNSKFVKIKKIFALPIFALMFILFVQKTYAENKTENISARKISKIAFKLNDKKIVLDNAKKDEIKITDTLKPKKQILEQKPEIATPAIPTPPPKAPEVPKVETVKTNAEFPGGINAFRSGVASNFNTAVMTGKEGLVKTEIYFNIDENGKISNFRAEGSNEAFNKEAIKAVSTINSSQLWKPSTEDGKAVKSVYKLPLTIHFAN